MFDIAFSELVVIGVVALVVIGPDKLPKVARTVGHLLGRAQRYVNSIKAEIDNEIHAKELKNSLQSLQDEIRLHATSGELTRYEVGQVIHHDMPESAPRYQVGQVIRHDAEQSGLPFPQPAFDKDVRGTQPLRNGGTD